MRLLFVFAMPALLAAQTIPLHSDGLDLIGLQAGETSYRDASALRLVEKSGESGGGMAIVRGATFHDGTIDVDVAGAPATGAGESARGFIGIAFRLAEGSRRFECIYVRPTNARAADQLRRNHTTQYISAPDWPWERLRKETPGVYESWTDMVTGEWTHLKIAVQGREASLFVGNAGQPCLLIHDLKLGDASGGLALWIGPGTDGYFRNLIVSAK